MRQSGLQEEGEKLDVSLRNRTRLMLQNRKLLTEVFKLETMINSVIEKTAADQWSGLEQTQEVAQRYTTETEQQQRVIARLKKDIRAVKATLADHKYDEVRNEENQVTFLRRECERLAGEKETLGRQKREKQEALEYHEPINAQTASTLDLYKRAKAANAELKARLHQLEREVARLHNIRHLAKSAVPPQYDNPDYQFIKIDTEVAAMRKEMRRIEEKWRGKVDAIDREFFALKDIRMHKTAEIEALERELKNHENHVAAIRDEAAVASDRHRIASLVISPQKRKEMQELLEDERQRLKRLSPRAADKTKSRANSKTNEKSKPSKTENQLRLVFEGKEETSSEKPQQAVAPYEITQYSQKPEKKEEGVGKPVKMSESIGVGTSFYYNDD